MDKAMEAAHQPQATTRMELVAILEGLRDVLVQLDSGAIDARYVDFAEMANRVEECIDEVRGING